MMNGMRGGSNAVGAGGEIAAGLGGVSGGVGIGGGGVVGGSGLVLGGDVKYPANCAARISVETNSAAACADGSIDPGILDKLYEPKPNKKIMRVITVIGYIFTVSMVAILLSLYYLFLWNPYIRHHEKMKLQQQQHGLPTAFPPKALRLSPPQNPERSIQSLSDLTSLDLSSPPSLQSQNPFMVYSKVERVKRRSKWSIFA